MATEAKIGYGTQFLRGNGASPEVFTAIPEVFSISGPERTRPKVEVTHFESPDGYREYVAGLKEVGSLTVEMNLTEANRTLMLADFDSGAQRNYQIIQPIGSPYQVLQLIGTVEGWVENTPVDDRMTGTLTVAVVGNVVFVV